MVEAKSTIRGFLEGPMKIEVKKPDFGIYSQIPLEPSGCFYYRVQVPMRCLQRLGLANICIDQGKGITNEERGAVQASSDIVLMYASSGKAREDAMEILSKMKPGVGTDGKTFEYPPSVIFDMDDNIDYVHPFNPAFVGLGTRNWNGDELNPGDRLNVTMPDGSDLILWDDKKTRSNGFVFDVLRNQMTVAHAHKLSRMAEGVTVASTFLKEYYEEIVGCKDVYFFPNSVIPEDYPKAKLAPRDDGTIRILWQGGASHLPDWFPLRTAIREICIKYPQVRIIIWGQNFPWIHDNIPHTQLEFIPWIGYDGYKAHRTMVDADINLCPLIDSTFNRSKSCIKWYEASIISKPEATLAGRVRPYTEEIVDGETALLYDTPEDFVEKLSALIENEELRRKLGERAKKWVLENRHYEKTVPALFEFYQEIRARKRSLIEVP
jgi:glycosyl transferase family 1